MRHAFCIAVFLGLSACATSRTNPDQVSSDSPTADPAACTCEAGCTRACPVAEDVQTEYRAVPRENTETPFETEPADAFDAQEPEWITPLAGAARARAATSAGVDESQVRAAWSGDFVRGRGVDVVVASNDGVIRVIRAGSKMAEFTVGELVETDAVRAAKFVDDRIDLVVAHRVDGEERLIVLRCIGNALAKVFDAPASSVEHVVLGEERAFRVTQNDQVRVHRWNKWEGMFRVPARAPTAPRR